MVVEISNSFFTQKNGRLLEWKRKLEGMAAIIAGKPVIYGQPLTITAPEVKLDGLYLVDSTVTIHTDCKGENLDSEYCMECQENARRMEKELQKTGCARYEN